MSFDGYVGERTLPDEEVDDSSEPNLTPITGVPRDEIDVKDTLPNSTVKRLFQAVKEMPEVEKTGDGKTKNKHGEVVKKWKYLEDRVLTPEARRVFIRNGLMPLFSAEDHSRGGQYLEKNRIQWTVEIHGVGLDEEPIVLSWISEGDDYSGKGVSKAVTSARKDFFRTQLMVSGGPEIENAPARDSPQEEDTPVTPEQKRELKNLVEQAEELGYDVDILPMPENAEECDRLVEHLEQVTNKDFEKASELAEEDDED